MGNPAGVRRDFQALEQRRWRAAQLLKKGVHQSEVARQVGAHRQSVSRWAQQLEAGGLPGLRKAGRAGRKPRLRAEDLQKIERGLKRGPEALGYETGSITTFAAICTTRSRTVGIPNGRCFPSAFGMYRRFTGEGRYRPARNAAWISAKNSPGPRCSITWIVSASIPAAPPLLRTRLHASHRTSLL